MENQERTVEQTSAPKGPELTVSDLVNIRSVIDVAVRRGTFNASEISGVGSVFDKLNAFIVAVSSQKPEGQPTTETNQ